MVIKIKKMNTKITTLLLLLSLSFAYSQQQVITFEYDDSGNRILRQVIEVPAAPPEGSNVANNEGPKSKNEKDSTSLGNPVISKLSDGREVNIFPNPTKGQLQIEISEIKEGETGELLVLSMEGKVIEHRTEIQKAISVDLSQQSAGNYILKLKLGKQRKEWQIVKK